MNSTNETNMFPKKYELLLASLSSFFIPFTLFLLTLEREVIGGDTTWFALQIPKMEVLAPTGYPAFSIFGKLFSIIPISSMAYRLNLLSAFFGSLTILFLFLAIRRIIKSEIISLTASLTFAFVISFWSVANRFELDTINSFFIAFILFTVFLYQDKKNVRFLYFCFAALGLSLTDHPIAFFIMPAFLVYIVIIEPRIFRSLKTVLLSILFFILPLSFYAFIPIRSLQGFGTVHTLKDFLFYITGRYTTGTIHGGSFFDKDWSGVLIVVGQFFKIIYLNYGIILLIIAAAGMVYLFKKNLKFAICSVFIILINLSMISLYLTWAPQNQVIDSLIIIVIYIAMGFKLIMDFFILIFKKLKGSQKKNIKISEIESNETGKAFIAQKGEGISSKNNLLTRIITGVLLFTFFLSPLLMAVSNYKSVDRSEVEGIYVFWGRIFDTIEDNSSIYVSSSSANIGKYISEFERQNKNIKFVLNDEPEYSIERILQDLKNGKNVYVVNPEESLIPYLNYESMFEYLWKRFNEERFQENVVLFKVLGEKIKPEIEYEIDSKSIKFGEEFIIKYNIINNNPESLKITSLELELTDALSFGGPLNRGDIIDSPGISQGKFMWVKEYLIGAEDNKSIAIMLRAAKPGDAKIMFRITSQNSYFEAEVIDIKINQ